MFDEHDILILRENGFHIYPAENGGEEWAMTLDPIIKSIIVRFEDFYYVSIVPPKNSFTDKKHLEVKTIEEAIFKAKQVRDSTESDWIVRDVHLPRV